MSEVFTEYIEVDEMISRLIDMRNDLVRLPCLKHKTCEDCVLHSYFGCPLVDAKACLDVAIEKLGGDNGS